MHTRPTHPPEGQRAHAALPRLLVLALAAVVPLRAASQEAGGWVFRAPGGAHAFFAVLGDLPVSTVGPFRYYQGGGRPRGTPSLRRALARPQFELLHFVPLYAPGLDARALAGALRVAATSTAAGRESAFLDATLRATLSAEDRRVLPELADLVEAAAARPRELRLDPAALERRWREHFEPPLRAFLAQERLTGGMVLLSESLGAEGRIFAGRPEDPDDNVIAVGSWPDARSPDAPLLAMLRELCFPLVTRSMSSAPAADAASAGVRSALAAVRCGGWLADAVSPAAGRAYRALWTAAGPHPELGFDAQFPVDPALARTLFASLERSLGGAPPP